MAILAAWEIGDDDVPKRIPQDRQFLERNLESWIERDPSLLSGDVRWAARQLHLPDGSRLDLLGLTNDGTWVIAELKPGPLWASVVDQVLHYFLQISMMSDAELAQRIRSHGLSDASTAALLDALAPDGDDGSRDYLLLVAGVGTGEAARDAAAALARHGFDVPIRVVTFEVLRDSTGRRVLVREIEDTAEGDGARRRPSSSEDVLVLAQQCGVRAGFQAVRQFLLDRGYREQRRGSGLNFNLGSRLQCLWVRPAQGAIHFGYLSSNFPTLFGVDENRVEAELGDNWVDLPPQEALDEIGRWVEIIEGYRRATEEAATAAI